MVQTLDAPVPQTVGWNSCQTCSSSSTALGFDFLLPVPEQVIEVPKILPEDVPFRAVLRDAQLVEQLVEVPTIVSFSSLQRTVEQNVDIPVVGGSGAGGGLSGFRAGQHFSVTAQQIVDDPVPRPGVCGSLQGLHRGQSSTAFLEQIAVSPDPGGGLQNFPPVQSSAASSSVSPGHAGQGVFRTFPRDKKVRRSPARWMTNCFQTSAHPRRRLMVVTTPGPWSCPLMRSSTFWNRHTGMTSWSMPDGWLSCWLLHADGSCVHLQSQVVCESIDEF